MLSIIKKMSALATTLDKSGYLSLSDRIDNLIRGWKYSRAFTMEEYMARYKELAVQLERAFHAKWSSESIEALRTKKNEVIVLIESLDTSVNGYPYALNLMSRINVILGEMLRVVQLPENKGAHTLSRQQYYNAGYLANIIDSVLTKHVLHKEAAIDILGEYGKLNTFLKDIFWSSWNSDSMLALRESYSKVINILDSLPNLESKDFDDAVSNVWTILKNMALVAGRAENKDAYCEYDMSKLTSLQFINVIAKFRTALDPAVRSSPKSLLTNFTDGTESFRTKESPSTSSGGGGSKKDRTRTSVIYLQEQVKMYADPSVEADGRYGPITHAGVNKLAQKHERIAEALRPLTNKSDYSQVTSTDIISAEQGLSMLIASINQKTPDSGSENSYHLVVDGQEYDLMLPLVLKYRGPMYIRILMTSGIMNNNPLVDGQNMTYFNSVNRQILAQLQAQGHRNMAGHLQIVINEIAEEFDKRWSGGGGAYGRVLKSLFEEIPALQELKPIDLKNKLATMIASHPKAIADVAGRRVNEIDENTPIVDQNAWARHKGTFINYLTQRLPNYLKGN